MTDPMPRRIKRSRKWTQPCSACGARSIAEGYRRCLDDTDHSDCAHSVIDTPCPMDDAFGEIE